MAVDAHTCTFARDITGVTAAPDRCTVCGAAPVRIDGIRERVHQATFDVVNKRPPTPPWAKPGRGDRRATMPASAPRRR